MTVNELDLTGAFEFTIQGHIEPSNGGLLYLVCHDATRLLLTHTHVDCNSGSAVWHVIPSTDSTGIISNVTIIDKKYDGINNSSEDRCHLVGRVVQLSLRHQVVLFKVELQQGKKLTVTLTKPDPRMKVGQLWSCTAIQVGCTLEIAQATPLSAIPLSSIPVPATITERVVLPDPLPPNDMANHALYLETGTSGWQLSCAQKRAWGWEWEAFNPELSRRARVQVGSGTSCVYEYKDPTDSVAQDVNVDTSRLVLTPLGAALGIGASCFRVEIGPYEVVLDCGTRPKGSDPLPALEYLKNPDLLLITHAHQDHIGAVPVFHARYPGVRMICTPGTREIAHVMLTDCLKVQQNNEDSCQLFDRSDLERTLFRLETQPIGQDFEPLPGLKVRFIHAGHIVGAACIYLRYGSRSLLYTGDYNTASSRTTSGLKLAELVQADMLITESTYGADTHPSRKTQETALLNAIASVVQSGGNVLIPAFALGRAQEILLALRTSAVFGETNCTNLRGRVSSGGNRHLSRKPGTTARQCTELG